MNAFRKFLNLLFKSDETPTDSPSVVKNTPQHPYYAMALGRVAGFFLPMKATRAVNWTIGPVSISQQQPANYLCYEFKLSEQAAGCLVASENSATAMELARRVAQALASTYSRIEAPELSYQKAKVRTQIACWLTTVLDPQELALQPDDPAPFEFTIGLDERLLDTLIALDASYGDERGDYATYLECQVVTAWLSMVDATIEGAAP